MSTQLSVGGIAVLDGSGFIGSHVVPALVEAGVEGVSYDEGRTVAPVEHLRPERPRTR